MASSCYKARAQATGSLNPDDPTGCPCICHQLNPPIDLHTYCVLKNMFRKALREICKEDCKRGYSVFNGGKSMTPERAQKCAVRITEQIDDITCGSICRAMGLPRTPKQPSRLSGRKLCECAYPCVSEGSSSGSSRKKAGPCKCSTKSKTAGRSR